MSLLDPRQTDPLFADVARGHAVHSRSDDDNVVVATTSPEQGLHGGYVPSGPDAIYLLVPLGADGRAAGTPERAGGWRLEAYEGSDRCWSTSLSRRGAPPGTDRTAAQEAAERFLAAQGVAIQDWRHGQAADGTVTRAARARSTAASRPPTGSTTGDDA